MKLQLIKKIDIEGTWYLIMQDDTCIKSYLDLSNGEYDTKKKQAEKEFDEYVNKAKTLPVIEVLKEITT